MGELRGARRKGKRVGGRRWAQMERGLGRSKRCGRGVRERERERGCIFRRGREVRDAAREREGGEEGSDEGQLGGRERRSRGATRDI